MPTTTNRNTNPGGPELNHYLMAARPGSWLILSLTLLIVAMALVWSFLGYYFSPFHLCQLLTVKAMGCSSGSVYKEHMKMMPVLSVAAIALFLAYRMIFG